MLGLLVGGQFHDKLFVTIDLTFHHFHVIMWIVICIGLVVEICHRGSFVKNLTLKRKVFCQILCDKSHHTQIEYTKELSIKRSFIDAYNIAHTLLHALVLLIFYSLLFSLHLFTISLLILGQLYHFLNTTHFLDELIQSVASLIQRTTTTLRRQARKQHPEFTCLTS